MIFSSIDRLLERPAQQQNRLYYCIVNIESFVSVGATKKLQSDYTLSFFHALQIHLS